MSYTVYAIYNLESDKIYIGQTINIEKRLFEHNNASLIGYTSRFPGKWEMIYQESSATRQEALLREKQLKSHRGRDFIKSHIPMRQQ